MYCHREVAELDEESRRFDPEHRLQSWEFTKGEIEAQAGVGTSTASICIEGRKIMKILLVCVRGQKRRASVGPSTVCVSFLLEKEGWQGGEEGRKTQGQCSLPPPLWPKRQHSSDESGPGASRILASPKSFCKRGSCTCHRGEERELSSLGAKRETRPEGGGGKDG